MKIVRSILAIVLGTIVAMTTIMGIQGISSRMYPLPDDISPNDMKQLNELLPTLPIGAMLMVLLSWEAGAFAGGGMAALIAASARCVHAGIIGGLVLVGTIAILWMMPAHPDWMKIAGLLLPLPVSLLAGKLVSMVLPVPPPPPAASYP